MSDNCNFFLSSCLTANFPEINWRQDSLIRTPRLDLPYDQKTICKRLFNGNTQVCLSWYPQEEATTYLLQWAYNTDFNGPSLREVIIDAPQNYYCLNFPFDIRQGEPIYWRVQAANLETGGVSNKSQTRQFTYDCGTENRNSPTLCDEYAVKAEIDGPADMSCCGNHTFSLSLNNSNYSTDHPFYILIRDIDWEIKHNNGTLGTGEGQSTGSEYGTIFKDDVNPAKAVISTNLDTPQVVSITARVTYTFPNKDLYTKKYPELADLEDFTCDAKIERFVDCSYGVDVQLAFDQVVEELRRKPEEAGTEIAADANYFLTGPVRLLDNICSQDWQEVMPNCVCGYGRISLEVENGARQLLEIGEPYTFQAPCCFSTNPEVDNRIEDSDITVTLISTQYGSLPDCTQSFDFGLGLVDLPSDMVVHTLEVQTPKETTTERILFDCNQCACDRFTIKAKNQETGQEALEGEPIGIDIGTQCAAPPINCTPAFSFTVVGTSTPTCIDGSYNMDAAGDDLLIDVRIDYFCEGDPNTILDTYDATLLVPSCDEFDDAFVWFEPISATFGGQECSALVEFYVDFDLSIPSRANPNSVTVRCTASCDGEEDQSGIFFTGNKIFLDFYREEGSYLSQLENQAPCECLPEQNIFIFDFTNDSNEDEDYNTSKLLSINFDYSAGISDGVYLGEFTNSDYYFQAAYAATDGGIDIYILQRKQSNEEVLHLFSASVNACAPFEATADYNIQAADPTLDLSVTIEDTADCIQNILEARTNIPLGCHLNVDDRGINVNAESLIKKNDPEGRDFYLKAVQQGSCQIITPPTCFCIPINEDKSTIFGEIPSGLELIANASYTAKTLEDIPAQGQGRVEIIFKLKTDGNNETFVTRAVRIKNPTSIEYSEGETVIITATQDCQLYITSGGSDVLDELIAYAEREFNVILANTGGNSVGGDDVVPESSLVRVGNSYQPQNLEEPAEPNPCQNTCLWVANSSLNWELDQDRCSVTTVDPTGSCCNYLDGVWIDCTDNVTQRDCVLQTGGFQGVWSEGFACASYTCDPTTPTTIAPYFDPDFCEPTTTTLEPPTGCECLYPPDCPLFEGECTETACSERFVTNPGCIEGTTTTTTSTTTQTPCEQRSCKRYRTPVGGLINLYNECGDSRFCYCPADPAICETAEAYCAYNPSDPVPCTGNCNWVWSQVLQVWYYTGSNCTLSGATCGFTGLCGCQVPNYNGTYECQEGSTSCSCPNGPDPPTTDDPTVSCSNFCRFFALEDLSGWAQDNRDKYTCPTNCPCADPQNPPTRACEVVFTQCGTGTTTTTTTTTTGTPGPEGACCVSGICSQKTEVQCANENGTWLGEGTTCNSESCVGVRCCTYSNNIFVNCNLRQGGCQEGEIEVTQCFDCPRYGACCEELEDGSKICDSPVLNTDCNGTFIAWDILGNGETFDPTCEELTDNAACSNGKRCCIYDIDNSTGTDLYLFDSCDPVPPGDDAGCSSDPTTHVVLLDAGNTCDDCPTYGSCCQYVGGCVDNVASDACNGYFYPYSAGSTRICTDLELQYASCGSTTTTADALSVCCKYIEVTASQLREFFLCDNSSEVDCTAWNDAPSQYSEYKTLPIGDDCSDNPCTIFGTCCDGGVCNENVASTSCTGVFWQYQSPQTPNLECPMPLANCTTTTTTTAAPTGRCCRYDNLLTLVDCIDGVTAAACSSPYGGNAIWTAGLDCTATCDPIDPT